MDNKSELWTLIDSGENLLYNEKVDFLNYRENVKKWSSDVENYFKINNLKDLLEKYKGILYIGNCGNIDNNADIGRYNTLMLKRIEMLKNTFYNL